MVVCAPLAGADCNMAPGAYAIFERDETGNWILTYNAQSCDTVREEFPTKVVVDETGLALSGGLLDIVVLDNVVIDLPENLGRGIALTPDFLVVTPTFSYESTAYHRRSTGELYGMFPGGGLIAASGDRVVVGDSSLVNLYRQVGDTFEFETNLQASPALSSLSGLAMDGDQIAFMGSSAGAPLTVVMREQAVSGPQALFSRRTAPGWRCETVCWRSVRAIGRAPMANDRGACSPTPMTAAVGHLRRSFILRNHEHTTGSVSRSRWMGMRWRSERRTSAFDTWTEPFTCTDTP